jgi:SAM-dependent methyltransferase
LEIGCGRGDFLKKLETAGWQARGIEPAAAAAKQAIDRGLNASVATIEDANFEPESFDAIFLWMVLEHLIDPRTALQRISDWLRPGGWLCLSVPNYGSWERRIFGKYWAAYEAPRHLHHFQTTILKRLLRETGFVNVRVLHQRNIRNYYGSIAAWLLSRDPRSRWGHRLLNWVAGSPPLPIALGLAPLGLILAGLRQGGRLTVIARKPEVPSLGHSAANSE